MKKILLIALITLVVIILVLYYLPVPTLGGLQLWSDVVVKPDGSRIQQHVWFRYYRYLNKYNIQLAWGSKKRCIEALKKSQKLKSPENSNEIVLLIHGLGRSRYSLRKIEKELNKNGYHAVAISYSSTRKKIKEHADQLEELLNNLEGVSKVSFITHSLGGIVLRETLSRDSSWKKKISVGKIVQMAPPNNGSDFAKVVSQFKIASFIIGDPAEELSNENYVNKIPKFNYEYAVVAGTKGYNNSIKKPNDSIVTVEETKLKDTRNFITVKESHTFIMDHPKTIESIIKYFNEGTF